MSGTKDCKFCDKRGLLWLPLRYSAVGAATPAALDPLPKLTGKLGQGVSDLALTRSKYAVRLLRSGYLYVLLERKGIKYWDAYKVLEDAFLYKFNPEDPPQVEPSFSCDRSTCGINASMVAIPEAKEVPHVWSLFTPAPLTKAKLDEYKANADKYVGVGKLQTFSPAGWLEGSTAQPHTLLAPELLTKVAEYILFTQPGNPCASELGKALEQQLFPASQDAYAGAPPDDKGNYFGRLGSLYNTIKRIGHAAFVLHDHIGVTQELNDFRNAALSPVEAFLAKREGEADNQRRLDVMQAIEDVHGGVKAHLVKLNAEQIQNVDQMNLPNHQASTAQQLRAMGRIAEAEKVEADIKEHERRKAQNRQRLLDGTDADEKWHRVYFNLLDQIEIGKFRDALESVSERCGQQANARAADHLLWLKAPRLVDAFDMFDPTDEGCGFEFTREHLHCTHGMFGVESNHATLADWINIDKVERSNLYMRANLYNHQELIKQASEAFAAVRKETQAVSGVEYIAPDKLAKFTKGLVDTFKKSDSAWDEWLRDDVVKELQNPESNKAKYNDGQAKLKDEVEKLKYRARMAKLSKFHGSLEGLALARVGELTRGVTSKGGKLDKGIVAVAGLLLYPRLEGLAEKIGMESFFLKLKAENLASIRAQTERAMTEGRMTPQHGEQHIKDYEKGGKYDTAAENAARREGATRAKTVGSAESAKVKGSLEELVRDEQSKLRERISLTQEELEKGKRPSTNNFRQMRMGVLMMSLEGLALISKLEQHEGEWTIRGRLEITGSILSLASMSCDVMYAAAKSIRELAIFGSKVTPFINEGADIIRGGFKITAGTLSTAAGMVSVCLDMQSAVGEFQKGKQARNWVLIGVYSSKVLVGGINAGLGFIAAFSYTGPMLRYLGKEALAKSAEKVMLVRTLWLIRVARFNMIGLVLTAAELGYTWCVKDDELEVWCKSSTFRKNKNTLGMFAKTPYLDTKRELEALEKAFLMVTGQPAVEPSQKPGQTPKVLAPFRAANAAG
ncbi:MAG: T6SS effector BTH_I2691 family protein [Rhizobacter sp.]